MDVPISAVTAALLRFHCVRCVKYRKEGGRPSTRTQFSCTQVDVFFFFIVVLACSLGVDRTTYHRSGGVRVFSIRVTFFLPRSVLTMWARREFRLCPRCCSRGSLLVLRPTPPPRTRATAVNFFVLSPVPFSLLCGFLSLSLSLFSIFRPPSASTRRPRPQAPPRKRRPLPCS